MIEVVKYKTLEGKTKRVLIIGEKDVVNSILSAFYSSFYLR